MFCIVLNCSGLGVCWMCFVLLLLVVMFCFCVCLRLVGAILDWFAGLVFCCAIILLFWTVDFGTSCVW